MTYPEGPRPDPTGYATDADGTVSEFKPQPPTPSGSVLTTIPGHVEVSLTDFQKTARNLRIILMNTRDALKHPDQREEIGPRDNVIDEVHDNNLASLACVIEIRKELEACGMI